jgi:transposase InsO family protein
MDDEPVLSYLATGRIPDPAVQERTMRRIIRRARAYRLQTPAGATGGAPTKTLYRILGNGSIRVVPPKADRLGVIESAHQLSGHFGIRRTSHLLLASFWWHGILADVASVVNQCKTCDRIRAQFDQPTADLQSLPIDGLFFRWGVDTSGPFTITRRGNKYIMHAIEFFSAVLVLEPMPTKESRDTAYAFQHGVLERFGSCAEVLTDNGGEYQGEFQQLLTNSFIDHRLTSSNHPQANGLAERSVGTVKKALRTHCEDSLTIHTWDEKLPFISLAYNCSQQASTRCSPYQLLYAREPIFPSSAARDAMQLPLSLDTSTPRTQAQAVTNLLQRSAYVRSVLPNIASNLAVAHHRDTLRYQMKRSGGWLPQLRKFEVGDFVYVRRRNTINTLQVPAKQLILRVIKVTAHGTVALQGRCGCVVNNHIRNLARCHLPFIDSTLHPELARPTADLICEVCSFPDDDALMLLCDICSAGWHTHCLQPPLDAVPKGDWICPNCKAAGITTVPPELRTATTTPAKDILTERLFADRATRARDMEAKVYDGRLVPKPQKGTGPTIWGIVSFQGETARPNYFLVRYDDGTEETMTRRILTSRRPLPAGARRPVNMVLPTHCMPHCGHPYHFCEC